MAYRRGADIVGFTPSFLPFLAVFHLVMLPVHVVNWLFYRTRVKGRENLRRDAGPARLALAGVGARGRRYRAGARPWRRNR